MANPWGVILPVISWPVSAGCSGPPGTVTMVPVTAMQGAMQ